MPRQAGKASQRRSRLELEGELRGLPEDDVAVGARGGELGDLALVTSEDGDLLGGGEEEEGSGLGVELSV